MHGAGLALGNTAQPAIKLGKHGVQATALGNVEAVRTVGGKNQIICPECVADTHCHRLLADREMDRALDAIGGVKVDDSLFNEPDQKRGPKQAAVQFVLRSQISTLPVLGALPPTFA